MFRYDGKLAKFGNKMGNLLWLNLLMIVTCIPIVTVGAAYSAMYYVCLQIVRDTEGNVTKTFFREFRSNFKKATVLWLIALAAGAVLAGDFVLMNVLKMNLPAAFTYLLGACAVVFLMGYIWVFPMQSHYENSIGNTLKNSYLIGFSHPLTSLAMIACISCPIWTCAMWIRAMGFCILFGYSLPGFLNAQMFNRVFRKLDGDAPEKLPEEADC